MTEKDSSLIQRVITLYSHQDAEVDLSDQTWKTSCEAADQIIQQLNLSPPANLCDLACGSGAVTTALAARGFTVTGIDCTPAQIERARAICSYHQQDVRWCCQDMRQLAEQSAYDVILLRDVIFGIFEDEGEDAALVRKISCALKPGGRCLLEVYDKAFAIEHGVENILVYDRSRDRFVRPGGEPGSLSIRLYDHAQWKSILSAAGLSLQNIMGWNWPNDPPPPPYRANVIVAEKPRSGGIVSDPLMSE